MPLLAAVAVALIAALLIAATRGARGGARPRAGELGQSIPGSGFFKDLWGRATGGIENIAAFVGSLIETVGALVGIIVDLVSSGVGSTLGSIQSSFVLVWEAIVNFAAGIFTRIEDAASLIWSVIANLASGLFTRLEDAAALVWGVIANLASGLFTRLEDAAALIWGVIANFAAGIFSRIEGAASLIWGVIANGAAGLFTRIEDAATLLFNAIVDAARTIGTGINDLAKKVESIDQSIVHATENLAKDAIDQALEHRGDLISALLGIGLPDDLVPLLADWIINHVDVADVLRFIGDTAEDAGKKAFQEVIDHTLGWGQITPEEAPGIAGALLAVQTFIGAALHDVAISKEFVPFLDNTATAHLSAFLGHFTGWEPTINAVWDPVISKGLGRPMEQLINKHTLTNLPGEGVLSELLGRRDIDDSLYDEQLSSHGFRPFWRTVFEPSAFRPARIFEIARIMQFVDISDADLTQILHTASYPDETITILLPVLKKLGLSRANGKLLTEALEARQKGFIDEGLFAGAMALAGIKETEQAQWQLAATAAYNNEVKSELVSVWRSAAGRDAMTDDELAASLAVIGISGAKQSVEILRAQAARSKKVVDEAAAELKKTINKTRATLATAYRTQFKKGLIDASQLAGALAVIGYAPELVDAFVTLAQAEIAENTLAASDDSPAAVSRRSRADLQQAYIFQFRNDAIDQPQLRASLVAIGVNDFEAASIAAREAARKAPSPVEITRRTAERVAAEVLASLKRAYAQQFQDGLISADALEQSVIAAGMDPDAAHAFRLLQEAISYRPDDNNTTAAEKLHATQLQNARKAAAIEEYRAAIIDSGELEGDLVAAGIFPDVAAALVEQELARTAAIAANDTRTAAQRQADQLTAAQKAAAVQQFRSGIIDDAALDTALVAAGIDPAIAGAIVARETARATAAAAAAQQRLDTAAALALENAQNAAAVQAYRSDLITADELEAALVANGVVPDLAAAIVNREVFRKVDTTPAV